MPTVRIPFPVPQDNLSEELQKLICKYRAAGFTTFFIFKHGNIVKLLAEIEDMNCSWMLFLKFVTQIMINCKKQKTCFTIRKTQHKKGQTLVKYIGSSEQWLIIDDGEDVSIAFRYDNGIIPCSPEDALLHCYLPTLDSLGFPFKANADFSTDPSRKHIITSDEKTSYYLSQIAQLIFSFLKTAQKQYNSSSVINLLCTHVGFSEAATVIERQLMSILAEKPWLPIEGMTLVTSRSFKIIPEWIDAKSRKVILSNVTQLLKYKLDDSFVCDTEKLNALLMRTGSFSLGIDDYVSILRNANAVTGLSDQILGKLWGHAYA